MAGVAKLQKAQDRTVLIQLVPSVLTMQARLKIVQPKMLQGSHSSGLLSLVIQAEIFALHLLFPLEVIVRS